MTSGKTAIITGGGSGLGKALVETFLKKGWNVATCGRRQGRMEGLISEFGTANLVARSCDIRLENQVSSFLSEISDKWSGADALILNAGTLGPVPLPRVLNTTLMDLRSTMETNYFANFNLIRSFKEFLNKPSVVVHVSSDAAVSPYPGWGPYASSKAAMDQLIRILDAEREDSGISAFSFDPGDMRTEMHKLALPDDSEDNLRDPVDSSEELYSLVSKKLEVV